MKLSSNKKEWEADLKRAVANKEFRVHYQPQLNLITGKIKGVEALIRWEHPERGMISPLEFIPLAEKTGLILPIGEWVLRTACQQNKEWQEKGFPPMVVAINLSACQLYNQNLVKKVQDILEETKLSPEFLELEITESMTMNVEHVIPVLQKLKDIGIKISLDDFGTGYSSLYHLKEFPIDTIKIDQSFVRTCTTNVKDATIVKTIIAMAHSLKLNVIAEGVETKSHLIFLQQNLCNNGQGYLFSKPLPADELLQSFFEIEKIVLKDGVEPEFSKQKWLEQALEQARQELKDTIRQQQGMIFKFVKEKGEWIFTLCDGELLYRMKLTPEEIIGQNLFSFIPEEDAKRIGRHYEQAWQGEECVTYEGEINGISYMSTLRPIRKNGKVIEVIGSAIDISERKRIEESLKLSELKYRLIAENSQDLICVIDKKGLIQYASPSLETFLGLSSEILEGNSAFEWMHPNDGESVQTELSKVVRRKTPSQPTTFRYKHTNGKWIKVEARATPVLNETGEVEYIVVISRVISQNRV